MTPFQAVYGFKPSMVVEVIIHDCLDLTAQEQLRNRQVAQQVIKENLLKAQGLNTKQISTELTWSSVLGIWFT
jgi:hypothetical protein